MNEGLEMTEVLRWRTPNCAKTFSIGQPYLLYSINPGQPSTALTHPLVSLLIYNAKMTTAHRPTFDPARGKDAQRGVAYHQRLMPAHTQLKTRLPGQGGDADPQVRDLRAQLLEAEAAHFRKTNPEAARAAENTASSKRQLEEGPGPDGEEELDVKRRRILEETRDVDADSDGDNSESSDEDRYA